MQDLQAAEQQLHKTRVLLDEALEGKQTTQFTQDSLEKKLQRAIKDRAKLTELLNTYEVSQYSLAFSHGLPHLHACRCSA